MSTEVIPSRDFGDVQALIAEFDNKSVDRNKVNDLMKALDQFESTLTKEENAASETFNLRLDAVPSNYEIKAEFKDSSGPVVWIGAIVWVGLVIWSYSVAGIVAAVFNAIGYAVAIFIFMAIFGGLIMGSNDQRRQTKETERLRREADAKRNDIHQERDEVLRKHRKARTAIAALRDRTHQDMKDDLAFRIQRSHELAATLDYQADVKVDADDQKTAGKPLISWRSEVLSSNEADGVEANRSTDITPTDFSAGILQPFFRDNIVSEIKVYSSAGGMLRENFRSSAVLLHHVDPEPEGKFLDEAPEAGETLNYYVVLETEYIVVFPNGTNRFQTEKRHDEHLIGKKRVTVPRFLSDAERLDEEISTNATELKRMKYRTQYEKTLAKMSGESADPDQALRDVLEKAETRRAREKQKQDYVAQIEKELSDAGASEDEIEEAIEEFYERLDA